MVDSASKLLKLSVGKLNESAGMQSIGKQLKKRDIKQHDKTNFAQNHLLGEI